MELQQGDILQWNEPLHRKDMAVRSGDIQKALNWFIEQTGQMPTAVRLHPTVAHLARELPKGLAVELHGEPLWAIGMRYGNKVATS